MRKCAEAPRNAKTFTVFSESGKMQRKGSYFHVAIDIDDFILSRICDSDRLLAGRQHIICSAALQLCILSTHAQGQACQLSPESGLHALNAHYLATNVMVSALALETVVRRTITA